MANTTWGQCGLEVKVAVLTGFAFAEKLIVGGDGRVGGGHGEAEKVGLFGFAFFADVRDGAAGEFRKDSFEAPAGLHEAGPAGLGSGGRGSEAVVFDESVRRKVGEVDAEVGIEAAGGGAFGDGLIEAE